MKARKRPDGKDPVRYWLCCTIETGQTGTDVVPVAAP